MVSRIWIVIAVALTATVFAVPAEASVQVKPPSAPAGGTTDIAFVVTNEHNVAMTKLAVVMSGAQSVSSVDTPPHKGWSESANVDSTSTTSVVWEGGSVAPGQSDTFVVTIKVPTVGDRLTFATTQSYSDGKNEAIAPVPQLTIDGGIPAQTTMTAITTTTVPPSKASNKGGLSAGKIFIGVGIALLVVIYFRSKKRRLQ